MIPPMTTGASTLALAQQPHGLGDQLQVRAGEDREPDDVDVLLERRGGDLLRASGGCPGRSPPCRRRGRGRRSARRRSSGRRARACRPGSGAGGRSAGRPRRPASRIAASSSCVAAGGGAGDAGRRAVVAEHLAQGARPLAGRRPGLRRLDRRRHDVRRLVGRGLGEVVERRARPRPGRARPSTRSSASRRSRSTSGSGVRMPPSAPAVSGESSVSVKQFWPITLISSRSILAIRSRWDSTRRAFM